MAACIRCGEADAIGEDGYCGHCHWAARTEFEEGFVKLRGYLENWQRFADWCAAHGRVAV